MTTQDKSVKTSWEWRSARFVLRAMAVLFCVGYLLIAHNGAAGWVKIKWVRSSPISSLTTVAEKALKDGEPERLTQWISMRPAAERVEIIKALEPYSGELSSTSFLLFSRWDYEMGNMEKSIFWYQLGRYRLRFDALRCGTASATEDVAGLLALRPNRPMLDAIAKDPTLMPRLVRDVLAFDAKYPANNTPETICRQIADLNNVNSDVVAREKWPAIRHTLRLVTEHSLKKMK